MTKTLRTLALIAVAIFTTISLSAQDLSSQRGESQSLGNMLGERIDHKGLVINPTPKHIATLPFNGEEYGKITDFTLHNFVDVSAGLKLTGSAKEFAEDINFINISKKGLPLNIKYGAKVFSKEQAKQVSGAYTLEITGKGISIVAYDKLGAYYGIRTLQQICLSQAALKGLPHPLYVADWPDLKYRGVVEGFYGTPWSHEVRLSLIDFYGMYKMNYYVYGPKDDPYHSSPNWRQNYPEAQAQNLKELVEACNKNRVHFV